MVEIAKALALRARIIIMDEPTSSLTTAESGRLFDIIRKLKSEGIGIVYISHRLEEVLDLADRVTVLRDGRHVGDLDRAEATHEKIVALMVGRELSATTSPPAPSGRTPKPCSPWKASWCPALRPPCPFPPFAARSWASPASWAPAARS